MAKLSLDQKETIIALWRDPKFVGSFSGIATFQDALKHEKNIIINYHDLFEIMRHEPDFITTTQPIRKFPRRTWDIHGYGTVWQADLAQMPDDQGAKYFLLCIDLFSQKIFCEALKFKTAVDVKNAFLKIFKDAKIVPDKLETDQGSEFLGNRKFFKETKIFFKIKTGQNKASYAEHGIYLVKRRLYRLLRSFSVNQWAKYLSQVVLNINNTPNSGIGGLKPSQINSPLDDPKIDAAKGFPSHLSLANLRQNQESYEKNKKKLQAGDFVYADFNAAVFDKSFDLQVR